MPSSISSSNTRIPNLNYARLFFMVGFLFVLFVLLTEGWLRRHGHGAAVVDGERFWAIHRADVYTIDRKKRFVIVGSSRAQVGLVPSAIGDFFPDHKVKQLAIDGTPALAIVRDLCEDSGFDGLILWSVFASTVFPPTSGQERKDEVYTQFFHDEFWRAESIEKNLNCLIGAYLQSFLVTLSPNLTLKKIVKEQFSPKPAYVSMLFNRYRPARYYSGMTQSQRNKHKQKRIERFSSSPRMMDEEKFSELIKSELAPLQQLLRSKGGEIILVRMPTTGEKWKWGNDRAPKEFFWDQISNLSEIPTIHFKDYEELMTFDCPDTSHLDASDAPEFSRRLSSILKSKLAASKYLPTEKDSSAIILPQSDDRRLGRN